MYISWLHSNNSGKIEIDSKGDIFLFDRFVCNKEYQANYKEILKRYSPDIPEDILAKI